MVRLVLVSYEATARSYLEEIRVHYNRTVHQVLFYFPLSIPTKMYAEVKTCFEDAWRQRDSVDIKS